MVEHSVHIHHSTYEQILSRMESKKFRITEQRKMIARWFAEQDGFITPRDLYDDMVKHYPGLSFDTVYRNLRTLVELEILEQFERADGVKFRLHCTSHNEHHHHFICTLCESLFPLPFCPMETKINIPEPFLVTGHRFEVYGLCSSCRNMEKKNADQ